MSGSYCRIVGVTQSERVACRFLDLFFKIISVRTSNEPKILGKDLFSEFKY